MTSSFEFTVDSTKHAQFIKITDQVQKEVARILPSGEGVVHLYVAHTTAGITINEACDPDVVRDMIGGLEKFVPWVSPDYRHGEGNSAAHIKASLMGSSTQVLIRDGKLRLGTWQGIFFCEFDGPRSGRKVWGQVIS